MEHVVSFDVSHVYRAIREVYQVHLYVFFFLFFLSLSLCVSLSFDSPLRNIFSSSLHPMKYKTTNPPRTNSNSYFKYLTLVRSTRLSLFDTSRKVVTENSFQVTFFKLFIRYFPFSIRDHFESCLSLEQSSNSERSDIGDRIV